MRPFLSHRLRAREVLYLKLFYKSILILLLTLCASFTAKADSTLVQLSVIDNENNETIPFSNVVVYQNGVQVAVAITDMEGRCFFKNLVPGKYDFKAIYVGYVGQEIKGVEVFAEKTTWLNIKLKVGSFTLTCCCSCFCYDDRTENWWPKLWTPYREAYKAWKEKKEKKQALAAKQPRKEIKLSEEPDEHGIADSIEIARIALVEEVFKEVNVYPNPTSDILHIESSQPLHNITLRNGEGKIVKEELMQSNVANINLSGFSSGVYYLNYVVNGKSETKKVAKVSR